MLQETGDRCCTVGLLFGCKYSKIFVSLALCLWAGWRSRYSNWLHSGRSGDRILVGGGEIFLAHLDRTWGPWSLLYNRYRVFPRGKERPGHDADPSPPSSTAVKKE